MLFERLQAQAKTPALVDALNMSFYSAILGRSIAGRGRHRRRAKKPSSARSSTTWAARWSRLYLPSEAQADQDRSSDQNPDAAVRARARHVACVAIGAAVARALNLPRAAAPEHEPRPGIADARRR